MDILIQPLNRVIQVDAGANLLKALQDAQVPMSYSCMAGRCGTCRCRIVEGEVMEGDGGFVYAGWCGSAECEAQIKDETKATIRVLPDEEFRSAEAPRTCLKCGKSVGTLEHMFVGIGELEVGYVTLRQDYCVH